MSISILKSLSSTSRQIFAERFPEIDEFEAIAYVRKVIQELVSSGETAGDIRSEIQHRAISDRMLYAGVILLEMNAIETFIAKESDNIH
ncbi:MAG: hypothetical protein ACXWT0_00355 [Methylobacter sp.]